MTVTALIRSVAAKLLAVALLGCDRSAMHDVFGPLGSSLYPFDELAHVVAPLRVLIGIQKNIPRVFQRDDLIHVLHAWPDILEIPDPYIVLHRVLLQPFPGRLADLPVAGDIALIQPDQLIQE